MDARRKKVDVHLASTTHLNTGSANDVAVVKGIRGMSRSLREKNGMLLCALSVALIADFVLTSCGVSSMRAASVSLLPTASSKHSLMRAAYIKHVIVVIQENRSFDNLFARFPGAYGATEGKMSNGQVVKLKKSNLSFPYDFGHSWQVFLRDYDGGKMDGFNLERLGHGTAGAAPYQYVDPKQIEPYWEMAKSYVLADHMFQTQGSGSFTAHQDLIAGGTQINATESLIDFPSREPWGCDAPTGTKTSLLTVKQRYIDGGGPFPCFHYRTLRDLLDQKHVSWKYYSPRVEGSTGATWNAFDAIETVRYGPEWYSNITPDKRILFDISQGALPAVSWLVPDLVNSDHPHAGSDTGPSWVATVVNTIGQSPYWSSTAVIILWDDWGGFYDNAQPPFRDQFGGLGFRVPMLIVSPYARKGYIVHTQYEFGSILRFIEDNWKLGRLGTSDVRATSIVDCFDFTQGARVFTPIQVKYSRAYFDHQSSSNEPVDRE